MMVDLQKVIESLIDRQSAQSREVEQLKRDLKRAFDEISALRRSSTLSSHQGNCK